MLSTPSDTRSLRFEAGAYGRARLDDAMDEFVLLVPPASIIFERASGQWKLAGRMTTQLAFEAPTLAEELVSGAIRTEPTG